MVLYIVSQLIFVYFIQYLGAILCAIGVVSAAIVSILDVIGLKQLNKVGNSYSDHKHTG